MPKSRGSKETHPFGSHGRAQALPGGEYFTCVSMWAPKEELQDTISKGILYSLLSSYGLKAMPMGTASWLHIPKPSRCVLSTRSV